MRVTLIHNPGAGAHEGDGAALLDLLKDAGYAVNAKSAKDKDWKSALDVPADVVAVAGGDGTVGRVAREMLGRGVPVAPLPAGTANNISRTLGLVDRHWEELVRAWPDGRRLKLDVGIAEGPWGKRHFIEGIGAGLFACLLSDEDPERKLVQHKPATERVAHVLEMLKKRAVDCAPLDLRGTLDGEPIEGRCLLAEVLNIPYVGPNLFLSPDSKPGDGTFDVVVVTEDERDRLTNYLKTWKENRERLAVLPSRQGKHLRVEWTGFDLHIDDNLWPDGDRPASDGFIDIRMAGAVEVIAPDPVKKKQ